MTSRIGVFLFMILLFVTSSCDTKKSYEDTFKGYFIKYYGEDGKQQGVDMIVNEDGTMLLLGNTINGEGISRIFLVKVDAEGNVLWQRNDIGDVGETAVDIEETIDPQGQYVILSNVFLRKNAATSLNEYDVKLSVINDLGDVQNSVRGSTFWKSRWDDLVGYSVTPISDNYISGAGYIISGNTSDIKTNGSVTGPDLKDIIVLCFKKDLTDSLWSYSVENQRLGAGIKVFESETYVPLKNQDRPFYLFGYSDVWTKNDFEYDNNFWLASLEENGLKPADDYIGGQKPSEEIMSQTIKDFGSGFISVGTKSNSTSTTAAKSLIMARSEVGSKGLKFTSGIIDIGESNNLEAVSISQSSAGGRYLILSNETSATGTTNVWLSKVNIDGSVIWSASFGALTKNDFAGTVRELPDGKIVILGTIELESQNSKMALIKLNSEGEFLN